MIPEPTYRENLPMDAVTPRVRRVCRDAVNLIEPGTDSDDTFAKAWGWFYGHGFVEPLSMLVIYFRELTSNSALPEEKFPADGGNERVWIRQAVEELPDLFRRMVAIENWEFQNPLCYGKAVIF